MNDTKIFEKGQTVLVDRYQTTFRPRYYVGQILDVVTKVAYNETVAVAYLIRPLRGMLRIPRWIAAYSVEGRLEAK